MISMFIKLLLLALMIVVSILIGNKIMTGVWVFIALLYIAAKAISLDEE